MLNFLFHSLDLSPPHYNAYTVTSSREYLPPCHLHALPPQTISLAHAVVPLEMPFDKVGRLCSLIIFSLSFVQHDLNLVIICMKPSYFGNNIRQHRQASDRYHP